MQIGSLGSILTTSYQPGTYGMGTYDVTAGVTDPTMTGAGDTDDVKPGYKSTPAECQTCKERKYIDGSDENVSFKAAAHIYPRQPAVPCGRTRVNMSAMPIPRLPKITERW